VKKQISVKSNISKQVIFNRFQFFGTQFSVLNRKTVEQK
jgi:hypothetical protein